MAKNHLCKKHFHINIHNYEKKQKNFIFWFKKNFTKQHLLSVMTFISENV